MSKTEEAIHSMEAAAHQAMVIQARRLSGQQLSLVRRKTDNPYVRKAAIVVTLENRKLGRCRAS